MISVAKSRIAIIPCNSAHYFLPKVIETVGDHFVNMVEATCDDIKNKGYGRVGLIGGEVIVFSGLYYNALRMRGTELLNIDESKMSVVREIIEAVKTSSITPTIDEKYKYLLDYFCNRGVDAVILGCTELPYIARRNNQTKVALVDSLACLADAVIAKVSIF